MLSFQDGKGRQKKDRTAEEHARKEQKTHPMGKEKVTLRANESGSGGVTTTATATTTYNHEGGGRAEASETRRNTGRQEHGEKQAKRENSAREPAG